MASASRPVGVRLCETCNAVGAIPAPVRASVTCAVAGFGDPAASLASVSVTVFLAPSVTAAAAAADAAVSAGGPPAPAPVAAGPAGPAGADAAVVEGPPSAGPVVGAVVSGRAPDSVPPTQPDKAAISTVAATATNNRRAAPGRATPGAAVAGRSVAGPTDEGPAVGFRRWSEVCRMVPFCHVAWSRLRARGGQCAPGADSAQPGGVPLHCPPGGRGNR